jgi:hydroxymethylpyrimidine/phosphomethylpyrimidine kinase
MTQPTLPVVLTIAGSDSGGGAGIQADLKTFHAFGVFGTSAITAITAQNTTGVTAVHPVPLEIVRAQIEAVAVDLPPAGVKTGMLATSDLVEIVAAEIARHRFPNFVCDPVMVASSGARLLDENAVGALTTYLLPLCALITPNLDEARILTALPVEGEEGMLEAARALVEKGAGAALVKGGHGKGEVVVDLLWDGTVVRKWRRPRLHTRNVHGTGCTLSAGIAAGLARGASLDDAVSRALDFVERAIQEAPGLGSGFGPLNHFVIP